MKRLAVAAAGAAVVLVLGSCGSKSSSGSAAESTAPAAAETTVAAAANTTAAAATDTKDPYCSTAAKLPELLGSLDGFEKKSMDEVKTVLSNAVTGLQDATKGAPSAISADLETLASGVKTLTSIVEKNGFDFKKAGADPALAKLMSDPKLQAAPTNIVSWLQSACGITVPNGQTGDASASTSSAN